MSLCEHMRERLPEFVAEGEPGAAQHSDLRGHLLRCSVCRAYTADLRAVERALRTYPLTPADPQLTARILEYVLSHSRIEEPWVPLPWSVWVPGAALIMAAVLVIISVPAQTLQGVTPPPTELGPVALPAWIVAWVQSVRTGATAERFWAVWVGAFMALAGIGVALGLMGWNTQNSRSLDDLEQRVADAAQRVLGNLRRAG